MKEAKTTAKDFFINLGIIISLYSSIISLVVFVFSVINYSFPDVGYGYVSSYQAGMTSALSVLIVMFPIFIYLSRLDNKASDKDPELKKVWVRKWAAYLTIFLLGLALAINLVTLLNFFLSGEITARFILKVLSLAVIATGTFWYYIQDIKGRFLNNSKKRKNISIVTSAVVIVVIISGIFIIGTPGQRRDQRLDDIRVSDLQNIQSQVTSYYQEQEILPENLSDLEDPLSYFVLPKDPVTGEDYAYRVLAPLEFELCANFSTISNETDESYIKPRLVDPFVDSTSAFWNHSKGENCFERTIDPKKFPILNK